MNGMKYEHQIFSVKELVKLKQNPTDKTDVIGVKSGLMMHLRPSINFDKLSLDSELRLP